MVQERLNGLALIAIENDLLETIQYEDLVDEFASKSARRIIARFMQEVNNSFKLY